MSITSRIATLLAAAALVGLPARAAFPFPLSGYGQTFTAPPWALTLDAAHPGGVWGHSDGHVYAYGLYRLDGSQLVTPALRASPGYTPPMAWNPLLSIGATVEPGTRYVRARAAPACAAPACAARVRVARACGRPRASLGGGGGGARQAACGCSRKYSAHSASRPRTTRRPRSGPARCVTTVHCRSPAAPS